MALVRLTAEDKRAQGHRLQAARLLTDMSVRDVADKMGVSVNAVSQWERGSTPSSAELRTALADLYRQPVELLFTEREAKLDQARELLRPGA